MPNHNPFLDAIQIPTKSASTLTWEIARNYNQFVKIILEIVNKIKSHFNI
jgi:hypothetical protein